MNEFAYELGSQRSCIRELYEYGRQRAAVVGEENVFDFSLGNPGIAPPKQVEDTIRGLLQTMDPMALHGYTPGVGDLAARQAIADDLNARFGTDITPGELFIGCGAAPELTAVLGALAIPDGEVLAIAPYFPEYKPFVEGAGLTFRAVSADIPDFQIRMEELAEKLNENTVAVIINSPNNPAGTVYSRKTLEDLAEILNKKAEQLGHPIYIISDEPYRELAYGAEVSFIPTIYRDTVVCYSYSKSLSLPGERIGYVYVPRAAADGEKLYAAVCGAARQMGHVCAPSLMQKVIAKCARLRPDFKFYDRNRQAFYEGLLAAGYEVAKPEGAFYLFVKAPGGDAKAFSQRAKGKELLVVPGDDFGCPDYFRVCYCVAHDKISRSLPIFEELNK